MQNFHKDFSGLLYWETSVKDAAFIWKRKHGGDSKHYMTHSNESTKDYDINRRGFEVIVFDMHPRRQQFTFKHLETSPLQLRIYLFLHTTVFFVFWATDKNNFAYGLFFI